MFLINIVQGKKQQHIIDIIVIQAKTKIVIHIHKKTEMSNNKLKKLEMGK